MHFTVNLLFITHDSRIINFHEYSYEFINYSPINCIRRGLSGHVLQVAVLLSVLQVRVLLLRREADGREGAQDEVKARAEGVRHANENILRARARTVLRAAGRRGRRVPEGG